MTTKPDFASRIVEHIAEHEVTPRSRWLFLARNAAIWIVLGVTIILGAFTVAASEFLLLDRDWDLYMELSQHHTVASLRSLPYLWLAALALLVWVTYAVISRTKQGYRFAPITILGCSVLASVGLGSALFFAGYGPVPHEYFKRYVPAYQTLVITRDRFWFNPERGLLTGVITQKLSPRVLVMQDDRGTLWQVYTTEDVVLPITGVRVRLVGQQAAQTLFIAERILPWQSGGYFATTSIQIKN